MSKNKNPALADDYPIRTERDVAIEREDREAKRGRRAKVGSKERPDYERGRTDSDSDRSNRKTFVY